MRTRPRRCKWWRINSWSLIWGGQGLNGRLWCGAKKISLSKLVKNSHYYWGEKSSGKKGKKALLSQIPIIIIILPIIIYYLVPMYHGTYIALFWIRSAQLKKRQLNRKNEKMRKWGHLSLTSPKPYSRLFHRFVFVFLLHVQSHAKEEAGHLVTISPTCKSAPWKE